MKTLKQLLDEAGVPEFVTNKSKTRVFRATELCLSQPSNADYFWADGQLYVGSNLGMLSLTKTPRYFFLFEEIHPPKIDGWELAEPLPRAVTVCGTPHCHIGGNGAVYTNSYVPENPVWIMKKSAPKFREHRKPTPEELEAAGLELDGDEPQYCKEGDLVVGDTDKTEPLRTITLFSDWDNWRQHPGDDGKRWHVKPVQNMPRPPEPIVRHDTQYRIKEAKPRVPSKDDIFLNPAGDYCVATGKNDVDTTRFGGRRWILEPIPAAEPAPAALDLIREELRVVRAGLEKSGFGLVPVEIVTGLCLKLENIVNDEDRNVK